MLARSSLIACVLATAAAAQQRPESPPAIVFEGRVLDVLGDGVPTAEVCAIVNGRTIARTVADGEGVYRIKAPGGGADLAVHVAGKVSTRLAWRGATTPRIRNVVLEDGADLRGRVLGADGAPVARAVVVAVAPGCTSQTTTTDDNGAYTLLDLPLRPLVVRALTDDAMVEGTVRLVATTTRDWTLPTRGDPSCRVRVNGLPADGAAVTQVRVYGSDLAAIQDGGRLQLDATGTALLQARSTCLVEAQHPSLALSPRARVVAADSRVAEFAVAGPAAPAATRLLQGRVRTVEPTPLGDLRLVVRDRSQQEIASTQVARDGSFRVQVVLPGDGCCRVGVALGPWLLLDDEQTIADGFSWVPARDVRERIELLVARAGMLHGIVRGAGGAQFALADIVVADRGQPHRELLRTRADRGGAIALGLPAGEHDLLAVGLDGMVCRATLNVQAGRISEPNWLPIEVGEVVGVLRDAGGAPVPGVDLLVASTTLRNANSANASERQRCEIVTDRNGRFRCRGLPVGDWTVAALTDSRVVCATFDVRANKQAAVDLAYGP